MFKDDINSLPTGDLLYLLGDILFFVIDKMMCTQFFGLGQLVCTTCHRNEASLSEFGELHPRYPDTAGCSTPTTGTATWRWPAAGRRSSRRR